MKKILFLVIGIFALAFSASADTITLTDEINGDKATLSKISSASGVATAIKVTPDPMGMTSKYKGKNYDKMTLAKLEMTGSIFTIGKFSEVLDEDKARFEVGWQEYTDS